MRKLPRRQNSTVGLSGTATGGSGTFTYGWIGGPAQAAYTVSEVTGGNYIYTLQATDANSCVASNTIAVDFISNPGLVISNVSVCPQASGTLNVSGATSYTWNNNAALGGSSLVDAPTVRMALG